MNERWTFAQIYKKTGRQPHMTQWRTARDDNGRVTVSVVEVIERGFLDVPPTPGPWIPSWSFAEATEPLQCVKGCRIYTKTQYVIGLGFDPKRRQEGPLCSHCYEREIRSMNCHYCGATGGEVEHVNPPKRSGSDIPSNMLPACRRCNASKRNLNSSEFEDVLHERRQLVARSRLELGLPIDASAVFFQPRLF